MTPEQGVARALAQAAAEQLHKDTGAPMTITLVVVALPPAEPTMILGAWVPSAEIAAALLRAAADSIDGGRAEIIDKRKERQG